MQAALDEVGIPWVMAAEAQSSRSIEASLSADLAVHVLVEGAEPRDISKIAHSGALPDLGCTQVNLYVSEPGRSGPPGALAALIRQEFGTA